MNDYVYQEEGRTKRILLPVGVISGVITTPTEIVETTIPPTLTDTLSLIANPEGRRTETFHSGRGLYLLNTEGRPYIEIKGCGIPGKGIINEYYLEDGRERDILKDPKGGFNLEKAVHEWETLKKAYKAGVRTQQPLALLKLQEYHGPQGEELGLLIRTGTSNIRIAYLQGRNNKELTNIIDEATRTAGRSLAVMHNQLGLCHNALHEENITLNGELVDLEYATGVNNEGIYKDLWYIILAFAETFGTPFNTQKFTQGYTNKETTKKVIEGTTMKEMEEEAKKQAEQILQLTR